MLSYSVLPTLNAILNSASAILVLAGYSRIRKGDRIGHSRFMISAVVASCLFLASYVVYHAHAGSVKYRKLGWIRELYFTVLISHTLLAAVVAPMVAVTLVLALRSRFDRHRGLARWTLPVWIYVSATGVIVYLMLYRF